MTRPLDPKEVAGYWYPDDWKPERCNAAFRKVKQRWFEVNAWLSGPIENMPDSVRRAVLHSREEEWRRLFDGPKEAREFYRTFVEPLRTGDPLTDAMAELRRGKRPKTQGEGGTYGRKMTAAEINEFFRQPWSSPYAAETK